MSPSRKRRALLRASQLSPPDPICKKRKRKTTSYEDLYQRPCNYPLTFLEYMLTLTSQVTQSELQKDDKATNCYRIPHRKLFDTDIHLIIADNRWRYRPIKVSPIVLLSIIDILKVKWHSDLTYSTFQWNTFTNFRNEYFIVIDQIMIVITSSTLPYTWRFE